MTARLYSRIALGFALLVTFPSCTPKPAAPPERAPFAASRPEARPTAPPPPAPRGPDIAGDLLGTARVGALHELDRRLLALVPSLVPAPLAQGLVTRRLLPELARELGINSLTLDALDHTRPSLFGLLGPPPGPRRAIMKPQILALLPLRGDPRLVVDGLRLSFPESTQEAWGGVQVRAGARTLLWVHARGGWVVVAPTAPLLDSALRTLAPLAQEVEEGSLQVEVRFARVLAIYRAAIAQVWQMLRSVSGRARGEVLRRPGAPVLQLMPLVESFVPFIDSLDRVELSGRIADEGWSFRVKVTPKAGGKAAEWLAALRSPGRFGLELLPPEAALVQVDRRGEAMRMLGSQVLGLVTDWVVRRVVTEDLPEQVTERGLMNRKTPAPLELYRRTLRDLNLADYRASHAIYRILFELQALRRLVEASVPRLVRAGSGESALAFYGADGRFGLGRVGGCKSLPAHRAAMMALAAGLQKQGTALLSALWDVVPAETRSALGIRTSPLKLVYNPVALQVGRVTASSLSLRIAWPAAPPKAAGRGGAAVPEDAARSLASARAMVEQLFGAGAPTHAWAYVGDRVISATGHDWQGRLRAMLQRALPGAKPPAALDDPRFQNALGDFPGESLSLTLVSGARLLLTGFALVKVMEPKVAAARGSLGLFLQELTRGARQAQHATVARERREGGAWVLEGRVPNDDLKGLLVAGAMLVFTGMRGAAHVKGSSHGAPPTTVSPLHP